jgi:large subunit ribosomal protein L4
MATLNTLKADGSQGGSLKISDKIFSIEPNENCVRALVNQQINNQRAGTLSTKNRGQVRGGGRKPYRQKGTGRARQGSIRAVQWRGGGVAFGPTPRDFSEKINRKVKSTAYRSIWSDIVKGDRLIVLEEFGITEPGTRPLLDLLKRLGVEGSALIVTLNTDIPLALSARNVPYLQALNSENLNIIHLISYDWIVTTTDVIKRVEEIYS